MSPNTRAGNHIVLWDGRLDNRLELARRLPGNLPASASNAAIVARAYHHWGRDCLPLLIGDWALSIWEPEERTVILARDYAGIRPLFYSADRSGVKWCSVLEPLVLLADHSFLLDLEYLAGWFGMYPAAHSTPYVGISAVPPSCYVQIERQHIRVHEFWKFPPEKRIRYRRDREYEEHFRELFSQAVERRVSSNHPVLAELSGGMDSSSIVCMADRVSANRAARMPEVNTVSYYSPEEPHWDELPFIAKVEEQRGRQGFHIEFRADESFLFDSQISDFMSTPGAFRSTSQCGNQFLDVVRATESRVLLSGIGGDEVLGGAPSPVPELADLLATGRLPELGRQLLAWALALRKPAVSLLRQTMESFLERGSSTRSWRAPNWLEPAFVGQHFDAIHGYPSRFHFFGPRPSFQENLVTIDSLRRQISCLPLPSRPSYLTAYPYLDRDLLEFLFAIPRDQLVRPGQRRSLMRRALAGIVPDLVLHRRRKAFVVRSYIATIAAQFPQLEARTTNMISSSLGISVPDSLVAALREARSGGQLIVPLLLRTFAIENWLRHVANRGVLTGVALPEESDASKCRSELPVSSLQSSLS